jgi:hypothetical protein
LRFRDNERLDIKDGLSDEDQEKPGVSTQTPPGRPRSLAGIFTGASCWLFFRLAQA